MILKIIGIIFVCLSSSVMGIYLANKIKFHANDLKEINNAINILKSEINFGMRTLCEASENIYNYLNKTQNNLFMANFFGNLNKKLENKIYSSASTAWIDCLKNIRNKTYLDQEDIIILESFAESISSFDRELQIKSLDIIISRFEKKILSLENKYNTNKKLFYNIGFLTGLLIIIVLI